MKKLLAIVLVLTLVFSMSVSALAGPTPATEDAVIEWTGMYGGDDGVWCPLDPNVPPIPSLTDTLVSMELDFGRRLARATTATFESWNQTDDGAPAGPGGVPAAIPGDLLHNRAGMLVLNSGQHVGNEWRVNVGIAPFEVESGVNAGDPTMTGFTLTLTREDAVHAGVGGYISVPISAAEWPFTAPGGTIDANTGGGGPATANVAEGGRGTFGANFRGSLTVIGNTANNSVGSEAKAVMTWTFLARV